MVRLIVGCGFFGSYLLDTLRKKTDDLIIATNRGVDSSPPIRGVVRFPLDLTKTSDLLRLTEILGGQDVIVYYFASAHAPDYVFEHPSEARSVNVDALQSFIRTVPGIDKLFYASTDCVYGENIPGRGFFKESDEKAPVNEYGRQKIEAENVVLAKGFNVLRYPFMLGPSLLNGKKHFYDKLKSDLINGISVEMIDGMFRCALSYAQAADLTFKLSETDGLPEVVNVCSDKSYSKYDIGLILAKNIGARPEQVVRISEEDGKKFFKDKRASSALMSNELMKSILGIDGLLWEEDKC